MSIDNGTKITQLLTQFNMTGKQLAEALHVHHTLVSKWRNGERALSTRSPIFRELVEYFMALDRARGYATIKALVGVRFPDARMKSRQEVQHWFAQWLTDRETTAAGDPGELVNLAQKGVLKGSFYIYSGVEGKTEASAKFMETALEDPKRSEMILFSQEDYNWFYHDVEYHTRWQEMNREYVAKGGITKKIHTVDQNYSWIATSLLNWIPSYLNDHGFSAYLPRYINSSQKMSVNIIKDRIIQFSLSADGSPKNSYTFMSRDPILNRSVWPVLEAMFEECIPLFERLSPASHPGHRELVDRASRREENSYHFSSFPPFVMISDELLCRILRVNNVDGSTTDRVLEKCRDIRARHSVPMEKKFRFIYDIGKMELLLQSEQIAVHELSSMANHPIFISPEIYRLALTDLLQTWKGLPNHEIALHPVNLVSGAEDVTVWVKENTIVTATTVEPQRMKVILLALQEVTSVNALYHYVSRIWDEIPAQERDGDWVRARLQQALGAME